MISQWGWIAGFAPPFIDCVTCSVQYQTEEEERRGRVPIKILFIATSQKTGSYYHPQGGKFRDRKRTCHPSTEYFYRRQLPDRRGMHFITGKLGHFSFKEGRNAVKVGADSLRCLVSIRCVTSVGMRKKDKFTIIHYLQIGLLWEFFHRSQFVKTFFCLLSHQGPV